MNLIPHAAPRDLLEGGPLVATPAPRRAPDRQHPILLPTGGLWYAYDPRPEDVRSRDFPFLARVPRWHGYTSTPLSVAEHCCRVALLLAERGASRAVQLQGLVHDLHELYPPGDVPGPVLRADMVIAAALRELERLAREATRTALGLPLVFEPVVHEADQVLLATERRDLMPFAPAWLFAGLPEPLQERIKPWAAGDAAEMWMAMFSELGGVLP